MISHRRPKILTGHPNCRYIDWTVQQFATNVFFVVGWSRYLAFDLGALKLSLGRLKCLVAAQLLYRCGFLHMVLLRQSSQEERGHW